MNFLKTLLGYLFIASFFLHSGCKSLNKLNFFSLEDDVAFGRQLSQQIESDPRNFPLLPERGNEDAYRYIRGLTNRILNSGQVAHRRTFPWEVRIIDDDETLNAFCAPGGFIYVYTGIIKYLDSEDQLAGVMGHEIAHAALRHSTQQMSKAYGTSILLSILTGNQNPGQLEQLALGLVNLKFGRDDETEADTHSVKYLCNTRYNAAGAAGFFEKIQSAGGSRPPAFLSTHPDPGNRVQNIKRQKQEFGCRGNDRGISEYNRIKSRL